MQDMSRSARRFQSILTVTFKESPAQRYYLCSVKSIKYFLPAFCILFLCLPFCRAADGEETLGRIPGADMTVYDMYRRTENRDRTTLSCGKIFPPAPKALPFPSRPWTD